ncbi:hypothetical protein ABLN87_10060 [Ruegeria sp. SCPT10]|uniref:hypothetical protein n=1 Tax=Ruegeria sp. SCP10 TaxID=3141377 RepID=UPI00333D93C9
MSAIEYVYSAHSAFAYLGSAELARICAKYDVTLIHKPVLLSPVVEAQGSLPFHARTQAHVDYFSGVKSSDGPSIAMSRSFGPGRHITMRTTAWHLA